MNNFFVECPEGRSLILQRYIQKPLLIHSRKFDIRVFVLVISSNKLLRAYICTEGYLRTSSKPFTLSNFENKFVHLTNDAVQKHGNDYSKFEIRNKLSYHMYQQYLDEQPVVINFKNEILPSIELLAF